MPDAPLLVTFKDRPCILRPALVAVAAGLIAAAMTASSASGSHPWSPIRHPGRQQTVNPVREQRPIHYPRAADPADRLLREFFELHTATAYEQAAVVASRLVEVSPDAAQAHYNHACVMGRLRRADEALSSLERAVEHGWRNLVHLSIDPDLDSLRATARYRAVVRRLKALILAETPALPEPWPERITDLRREVPAMLARADVPTAMIVIVENGAVVWRGTLRRAAAGPVLHLAANRSGHAPPETDLADFGTLLEDLCAATSTVDRPDATAPGFLQLTESSPGGVVLLRWSPQRRQGVVVVTAGGDRGPIAGQIAALALAGHAGRSSSESQ
ncbi:MAG: hypothetical protein IID28_11365 [Planctomycetes bacterium]|nr:hypothetical protein [Planctomycetota bacterium]